MDDRVSDLRARWTPEATAGAVAFVESRPTNFDLPAMEHEGRTYLALRGLRVGETQIDKCYLRRVNLRWAQFRDVGFKNARFEDCNFSQSSFAACYLRRAQFTRCDIVNAHFESCDFSQAAIADSRVDFASFKNCEIQLEAIKFQQEATPRAMVRVCRGLKLNAMSMGNFVDAGELTYLEKRYERLAYAREGALGRWLASALQNELWGYRERPWRLALVIVFHITLFGSLLHLLDPPPGQDLVGHVQFCGEPLLTSGHHHLPPHAPLAQLLSVLGPSAGIATFGLLLAPATKKIMHRCETCCTS